MRASESARKEMALFEARAEDEARKARWAEEKAADADLQGYGFVEESAYWREREKEARRLAGRAKARLAKAEEIEALAEAAGEESLFERAVRLAEEAALAAVRARKAAEKTPASEHAAETAEAALYALRAVQKAALQARVRAGGPESPAAYRAKVERMAKDAHALAAILQAAEADPDRGRTVRVEIACEVFLKEGEALSEERLDEVGLRLGDLGFEMRAWEVYDEEAEMKESACRHRYLRVVTKAVLADGYDRDTGRWDDDATVQSEEVARVECVDCGVDLSGNEAIRVQIGM